MKLNRMFLAVALLFATSSQLMAGIITTIGSREFIQGSGAGFGLIPVSIFSDGTDNIVNFEMSFTTDSGTANAFAVVPGDFGSVGTYFNASPNLTGWDNTGSLFSSDGTTVTVGFGSAAVAGILIDGTARQLLWLPVNTSLLGTFTLVGTSLGVNDPTFGSDLSTQINSGSFTVTAVPEPTSMALVGLIGLGSVAVRRIRGKIKA